MKKREDFTTAFELSYDELEQIGDSYSCSNEDKIDLHGVPDELLCGKYCGVEKGDYYKCLQC